MLTKEIGQRMLRNLLEVILGISDKEYQKRVWIRGEGPEIDDFTETVCRFFDNSDPILQEHELLNLTKEQYKILLELKNKFEIFIDVDRLGYLPEQFIDTPAWNEIVEMAKEVLREFHYNPETSE